MHTCVCVCVRGDDWLMGWGVVVVVVVGDGQRVQMVGEIDGVIDKDEERGTKDGWSHCLSCRSLCHWSLLHSHTHAHTGSVGCNPIVYQQWPQSRTLSSPVTSHIHTHNTIILSVTVMEFRGDLIFYKSSSTLWIMGAKYGPAHFSFLFSPQYVFMSLWSPCVCCLDRFAICTKASITGDNLYIHCILYSSQNIYDSSSPSGESCITL